MALDNQYLDMVGFALKAMDNQLALADGVSHNRKDRSAQADDTVVVHCCCEERNNLSKPFEGQGLKTHDVTKARIY